ncbi:MAG: DUF6883 domain-containing protein [Candidatus Anammoxibacter sp.]
MKLSENTVISSEKLTKYLLIQKKRNDKSQWLAKAGYTIQNWQILEKDLRNQMLTKEATPIEKTKFGQTFEISSELLGPNGNSLTVTTIWMEEAGNNMSKFITMYLGERKK